MLRYVRYGVEVVAGLVGVAVVLGLLLVWRLHAHGLSSDFLTPYVESGIETLIPDSHVQIGQSMLTWGAGLERTLTFHAEKIRVTDDAGAEIATIPALDAKISILSLLIGDFLPRELTIEHPQIRLALDKEGSFVFAGMTMNGTVQQQAVSSPLQMKDAVRSLANGISRISAIDRLAVSRLVIDVHDLTGAGDWAVSVPEITVERDGINNIDHLFGHGILRGHMSVETTLNEDVSTLEVNYAFDPSTQQHSLSSNFDGVNPAMLAGRYPDNPRLKQAAMVDLPLSGKISLTLASDLSLSKVSAVAHGEEGRLINSELWDKPCLIKEVDVSATYDRHAPKLVIAAVGVDFGGPKLNLQVEGVSAVASGRDMDLVANIKLDNLPMNRFGEIWPKTVIPNPREWMMANLHDGTYTHAEATIKGSVNGSDLASMTLAEGEGKASVEKARVTYLDDLPPVVGVGGEASFDLHKMSVKLSGGSLGALRLVPFTLEITGLSDNDQFIDIPLQVAGPLTDILGLLDQPRLGYAKALGLSAGDVDGKAEGTVHFRFPLLKALAMKDVELHVTASIMSLASTKLVPGVAIDQGNLAMVLDTAGMKLDGHVGLNKVPVQVTWQEAFAKQEGRPLRQVKVTGAIKDDQWKNFGVNAFDGTKGPVALALEMSKPDKSKMAISATLDMAAAAVQVDMLGWKKPAGAPALLKIAAVANDNKPVEISSIALRGPQITANGTAVMSSDMTQVQSLTLNPLVLGRSNVVLQFTQSEGNDGALRFEAKGASLDVSGLRGGKDPERTDPRRKDYIIQVDRLYTSENGYIDKAQGMASRDLRGWSKINLHGLANGDTALSIELTPQADGHRTLAISSDNFGKAMKGLGFTDTVKGGKLSVSGQSTVDNSRVIVGRASINDFTVEKLPVLARLLNATSPFGFSGLITDSASFSRFEGAYIWEGDAFTLTKAHAAGSAVGINIEGTVDMNSGDANLKGTLVPFSVMNNILNYIPVIGNLITGGENQGVLAVAYQIHGNLDEPEISVNPVSLLTPGFLRNLFFGDDATKEGK